MEYVTLNNGIKMPKLGYGVYQVSNEECERCVLDAISAGYRSIDTAQSYGNEEAVGNAINKCGVPREELFITTKVWITNGGYEKAKESLEESLRKLQTEYIDLCLIHQPFNDYYGTSRAMEAALKEGLIRAIGVSNFYPDRLIDLCLFAQIKPMVNQIEVNVFNQQIEAQKWADKYGVVLEAWAPFAEGRNNMFNNPVLHEIAIKHNKTVAQVILRWLYQRNIVSLAKSIHKERMIENFSIDSFELDNDDLAKILTLDTKTSFISKLSKEDIMKLFE